MAKHETAAQTKPADAKPLPTATNAAATPAPAATTAPVATTAATDAAPKGEKAAPFVKGPRNVAGDATIKMGADKEGKTYGPEHNPKRPGSATHERFKLYKDGATIESLVAAGVTSADIDYDLKKGFIIIATPGTPKAPKVEVKATEAEAAKSDAETTTEAKAEAKAA